MNLNDYARNRRRTNELIAYAKPYRLNIITEDKISGGGLYRLILEHPVNGDCMEEKLVREIVDTNPNPPGVLKGGIDLLRARMDAKHMMKPDLVDSMLISELQQYAQPFELSVKSNYSLQTLATSIELTVKLVPQYGFQSEIVHVPDNARGEVLVTCQKTIDDMRRELGWSPEVPEGLKEVKPFVLGCPDHGGAMVKVNDKLNHDEYYICLVPGCTKKARRKKKFDFSGNLTE